MTTPTLPGGYPGTGWGLNYRTNTAPGSIPSPAGTGGPASVGLSPSAGATTQRGIASLTWHDRVLRFRTNPNEIWWTYSLITAIEQTYGGRVVQILGVKMDDLSVKVDCGRGGWPYAMQIVQFMRDLMIDQRNGDTATFEYTTRNYKMQVYGVSVPFQDQVTSTVRELELQFKIQQDVSGSVTAASMANALAQMTQGVGFTKGQYNQPGDTIMDFLTGNANIGIWPQSKPGGIGEIYRPVGMGMDLGGLLGGIGSLLGGFL